MDSHNLLQEYVARQSEAAFAELVNRHVDLVYSTAFRIVQDPVLAEDVAQLVFIQLARKAGSIREGNALPGWLYRAAHGHAANALRSERTRRSREIKAVNLTQPETESALVWNEIESGLDEAMQTLSEAEQNAVVLRFFQGQSWRNVGNVLNASEDTAQRRVNSALEKLRAHFLKRGITISASILCLAIGTNAVQAAPATLGTHLAAGSLVAAGGAKSAGLFSTIIKTLVAKWQVTAAVVTGVAVVGVTITAMVEYRSNALSTENLRRGLVLHLGFDREEADDRVSDDSRLGNHGQVIGARWTANGRRGGGYEFRADGDQIKVPNHLSLNPANITISAWIKSPTPDASWRFIVDKSINPGYNLAVLGDGHGGMIRGQAHSQMSGDDCVWGGVVTDGQWHLLTTTYDGKRHSLYVDGRPGIALPFQKLSLSNSLDLIIGRHSYGKPENQTGLSFRGVIDDVRVYDRALSPAEVAFLFASADQ